MTMLQRRSGRVLLGFHDDVPPTTEEWDAWLVQSQAVAKDGGVAVLETHGGGPNAAQRKQLAQALAKAHLLSVVFTGSALMRGLVTAVSWLGVTVRAYDFGEFDKMQEYLKLSDEELELCRNGLREMADAIAAKSRQTGS